ncbi:hypothetical protein B7486_54120 [cyanobacterium TDX16]|nr:hypothetical protein B7486_54120 [cyanobacterium TDX16]
MRAALAQAFEVGREDHLVQLGQPLGRPEQVEGAVGHVVAEILAHRPVAAEGPVEQHHLARGPPDLVGDPQVEVGGDAGQGLHDVEQAPTTGHHLLPPLPHAGRPAGQRDVLPALVLAGEVHEERLARGVLPQEATGEPGLVQRRPALPTTHGAGHLGVLLERQLGTGRALHVLQLEHHLVPCGGVEHDGIGQAETGVLQRRAERLGAVRLGLPPPVVPVARVLRRLPEVERLGIVSLEHLAHERRAIGPAHALDGAGDGVARVVPEVLPLPRRLLAAHHVSPPRGRAAPA